jgi:hypothetical protein
VVTFIPAKAKIILSRKVGIMTIEIKILTAPGCTTCDQAKAIVQKFAEQGGIFLK